MEGRLLSVTVQNYLSTRVTSVSHLVVVTWRHRNYYAHFVSPYTKQNMLQTTMFPIPIDGVLLSMVKG